MSFALRFISDIVGWIYFLAWSISFYGQIHTNYKLKSVEGFKLDFVVLNFIGFAFYSYIYVITYFWQDTNPFGNYGLGTVRIQDLAFALHALAMVIVTCIQCCIYPRGKNKISVIVMILCPLYVLMAIILYVLFEGTKTLPSSEVANFIIILGYLKLSISVIKYIPPAYWNYKRKSTVGWSILNILLDLTGAVFSIAQTVIDLLNNTSGKINSIKFALGNIAIIFDVVFIIQHYVLYNVSNKKHLLYGDDSVKGETKFVSTDAGYNHLTTEGQ